MQTQNQQDIFSSGAVPRLLVDRKSENTPRQLYGGLHASCITCQTVVSLFSVLVFSDDDDDDDDVQVGRSPVGPNGVCVRVLERESACMLGTAPLHWERDLQKSFVTVIYKYIKI